MLWQAISYDGLWILVLAVFLAGLVRGFAGFGTSMVFMPIAAGVAEPVHCILMLMAFDIFGPLVLLPRAWRDGEPRDVGLLGVGAILGLPVGIYLLLLLDPLVFRWLVSILALGMLALLGSGWRYRNPLSDVLTVVVGWAGGFLGGIAALPGPPVILSYMSSPRAPQVIRGNMILYLFLIDILSILIFALKGLLLALPLLIGAVLSVPYAIAGMMGTWIFNPAKEAQYRRVAFILIASSAIAGLPIWGFGE
ncbi:membrane protein [Amylibacter marinus]|uniref:Probable membrane transporter protein n=1 Tax=Amylibacter marinus TaxID=1475483 RepID=A0ABQ5VTT1_9RHOB|nr:sulfite exporter TauE/SafE family protein [Amylibacter marinus]GLQ34734.1 membrane protein [Amylibacter marinus]